jgi:hypothetical protein
MACNFFKLGFTLKEHNPSRHGQLLSEVHVKDFVNNEVDFGSPQEGVAF